MTHSDLSSIINAMKKITAVCSLLLLFLVSANVSPQSLPKLPKTNINIVIANDMGKRGVSEQRAIAALMGKVAKQNNIAFLAIPGDPIHDEGVQSVDDDEWKLKIEQVYTASSLHAIPWYVVPGNHEYRGNVQALLDYSRKSGRWNAPARYFAFTRPIGSTGKDCLFVFADTTPMIDKYRTDNEKYVHVREQDVETQLVWIQDTLASSRAHWKIVFGHHPVYADTGKDESERADMLRRLGPILEKNGAAFYICGHIHNFQHIKPAGATVDYVVNSSASASREVEPVDGTVFCSGDPGFSVLSVSDTKIDYYMENHKGKVIYRYSRSK